MGQLFYCGTVIAEIILDWDEMQCHPKARGICLALAHVPGNVHVRGRFLLRRNDSGFSACTTRQNERLGRFLLRRNDRGASPE